MALFYKIRNLLVGLSDTLGFDARIIGSMTLFEYTLKFNDYYGEAIGSRRNLNACKNDRKELKELLAKVKSLKARP